jgi:hypothetical protein
MATVHKKKVTTVRFGQLQNCGVSVFAAIFFVSFLKRDISKTYCKTKLFYRNKPSKVCEW